MSDLSLLTNYPADTRAAALRRFQLLSPHLEDGVPLTVLAQRHKIPLRTMQHWLRQYRQHGLVGLYSADLAYSAVNAAVLRVHRSDRPPGTAPAVAAA